MFKKYKVYTKASSDNTLAFLNDLLGFAASDIASGVDWLNQWSIVLAKNREYALSEFKVEHQDNDSIILTFKYLVDNELDIEHLKYWLVNNFGLKVLGYAVDEYTACLFVPEFAYTDQSIASLTDDYKRIYQQDGEKKAIELIDSVLLEFVKKL